MKKYRIAVIGAGHLGKIHTRLLLQQPNAEVVAVVDPRPLAQRQILDEFQVETACDFHTILDQHPIDGAVIATPTATHFDIASELLTRKIHLLIEKPLTDSVDQAQALTDLAERNRCVVQVGHCERFNPIFQQALREIGEPKFVTAHRTSGFTFRSTDIGVVHDLMIHDIDLVNSIFTGRLVETRAVGVSLIGQQEDLAQARLQFSCGGVANLTASRCSYQNQRTMQIFGTSGFASIDFAENKLTIVEVPSWLQDREYDLLDTTPEQQNFIRENLFDKILPKKELMFDRSNAILNEQQDWLSAIELGESPLVTIDQGKKAVEIAQSILDSMASHCWSEGRPSSSGPRGIVEPMVIPFKQAQRRAA